MNEQQKRELKELIETKCHDTYEDIVTAKEDLMIITKAAQDKYGIKAAWIRRMTKFYYEANLEEEKLKANEIFDLFEEVMN